MASAFEENGPDQQSYEQKSSEKKAPEKLAFALEVNSKLNELIAWVIEHSPKKNLRLNENDFSAVREQFRDIACGIDELSTEPEPSEGGAQYVNVTPAPWP